MDAARLTGLYHRLLAAYGPQAWWPGNGDPFEVVVGAILTQRTAWRNAQLALEALRRASLLSFDAMRQAPDARLAECIRSSGVYRAKARALRTLIAHVDRHYGGDVDRWLATPLPRLRAELLTVHGIGPETADAMILYAANQPSFVVDAYTIRILGRLGGLLDKTAYERVRSAFMESLPADPELYGEFHALFVRHGKVHCRATPVCGGCPMAASCAFAGTREAVRG